MTLFEPDPALHLKPLRGRQIGLIPQITEAVKQGHTRIVIQAPTGYGKTVLAAHLMDRSAKKGKRPIFIAPAIALIEQTLASFEEQGIRDIGVIQQQHARTDWRARIQLASRDTLVRRRLPEVDFAIVDEVHLQRNSLTAILDGEEWRNKIVIGLSATPWSKGLGLHWTKLIIAATLREMIDDGPPTGLSPFKVWGPDDAHTIDTSGVRIVRGEFDETQSAALVSEARIVGDVVDNWMRRRQAGEHCGDRTFLYGQNRAHARSLMEAFNAQGVKFGYMDGETPAEDRERIFKAYRSQEIAGIANVGVLITGVDEDVRSIIGAALRHSEITHVQEFGRGLRLADGKDYLRYYDHAGNCLRIGLPTWIHHDTLDSRKPKDKGEAYEDEKPVQKPRKCKKCHAIIPPKTRVCPSCGDVYVTPNRIEHVAGELVEFDSGDTPQPKPKKAKMDEKQAFYSGLLMIAQQRGFKDGWVSHKYQEKFGVWPKGLERIPRTPRKAVVEFERESRKRYLAEKKQHEEAECLNTTLDQP